MKDVLDALENALRTSLDVRTADGLETFIAAGGHARYLRNAKLTAALHFDIEPAFLILDPLLGVLGVVELALPGALDPNENMANRVRRCIDRATYLRHLLLRDPELTGRRPLSVELVLLTADRTEDELDGLTEIGQALREALHDSNSLFHVGVSVLSYGGPERGGFSQLRRAFPWLLYATRRWLLSPRSKAEELAATTRSFRRLTLTDYRLPGQRKLVLADARIHLVHGPNGSGKSSIAEALELVTSGKIERLEHAGEKRYDSVIPHKRNGKSAATASVQLGWLQLHDKQIVLDPPQRIVAGGIDQPLSPGIDASSFRLDQALMDRLIGSSAHARAKTLLRAFFPEGIKSLGEYELATQRHAESLAKLKGVVDRLQTARAALVELQDWKAKAVVPTSEDYPTVLNRWLEQVALLDLLQRVRTVRDSVSAARAAGWKPSEQAAPVLSALGVNLEIEELKSLELKSKQSVDELQARLAYFTAGAPSATASPASPRVSAAAMEALNSVSAFLIEPAELESSGLLGHKLAAVVNAGAPPTYGPTVIGAEKWAEPLIKSLDSLIAACAALQSETPLSAEWPGTSPCGEYEQARSTHAVRLTNGYELNQRFLDKLRPDPAAAGEFDGSLIAAVNELMALFTPARWAYSDLTLHNDLTAGRLGVEMRLSDGDIGQRAELQLNTAELNLFTVALFLLCSGRVTKPLNLLIFDDPLQNMDELTAAALARGISKVVRLWAALDRPEELLFLFHGSEALQRFHAELAGALYRLPWLSPSRQPKEKPVTADQYVDVLAVQSIHQLKLRAAE